METTASLSIVIVNWNTRELTKRCIDSLERHRGNLSLEVFVIDNDSSDGSEEALRAHVEDRLDWVTILQSGANLGFGKACNIGLKKSRAPFVFFLNPDTEVFEGTLEYLVTYLKEHDDVGVVAPKLVDPDGTLQPSIRRFPTLNDQALILLKLHHVWKRNEALQNYLAKDFDYEQEQDVEQPMGAALCIRRSILKELGGFDEAFFLWFEEVDLLKRIADTGKWRIVYTPAVQIQHHKGQSFGQLRALKEQHILNTSMRIYFAKQRPAEEYVLLLLLLPISYALAALVQVLEWTRLLPSPKKAKRPEEEERNDA